MYPPPWDARLALQISAIFLLCMESCLLAQLHSSPMQSKAMEHSLPQRVRGRDCHCNESHIGIDIELEIIQDILTAWYQITTYHNISQIPLMSNATVGSQRTVTSKALNFSAHLCPKAFIQQSDSAPFSTSSGVPAVMVTWVTWIRMVMMRLKMLKPSESSVKGFLGKDVAWPHPWTCRSQFNGQLLGWRWMRWMRWMHLWDASLRWLRNCRNCGKCWNWGSFTSFSWSFWSQLPSKGWWITLCGLI